MAAKARSPSKARPKPRNAAKTPLRTIDQYLAGVSVPQRAALQKLRRAIQVAAPEAQECITYQVPAFRLGKMLVGFGAAANHCSFYLMSATTVAAHRDELRDYDTSKSVIRFSPERPLPTALVRKLVKARLAENAGSRGTRD